MVRGAFWKHQQLVALTRRFGREAHHVGDRVVADIAGQARAASQQQVIPDAGFHDADDAGQTRGDQHHVNHGGVVGGDDQGGGDRAGYPALPGPA